MFYFSFRLKAFSYPGFNEKLATISLDLEIILERVIEKKIFTLNKQLAACCTRESMFAASKIKNGKYCSV